MELYSYFKNLIQEMIESNEEWIEWFQYPELNQDRTYNKFVKCCCGVSRCTIIDSRIDWVVKFDINSDMEEYCEREIELYRLAKENNLENIFAEGQYIGEYWDETNFICLRLYAFKKANTNWNKYVQISEEENIKIAASPLSERSKTIAALLLRDWGSTVFKKLEQFCKLHRINDLHNDNVGFINGKIVLIDYAGFWSNYGSSDF